MTRRSLVVIRLAAGMRDEDQFGIAGTRMEKGYSAWRRRLGGILGVLSQESVEVAFAAWSAYLTRGVDAALEYFAEDVVSEDFPELPDRATYRGRDGWRQRRAYTSRAQALEAAGLSGSAQIAAAGSP